jgi:hypothetical protein
MLSVERIIVTFAINAVWQPAVVIFVALLAARAVGWRAAARHRMFVVTMIVAVGLPLFSVLPKRTSPVRLAPHPAVGHPLPVGEGFEEGVAILWGVAAAIAAVRFAIGLVRARRIVTRSVDRGELRVSDRIASPLTIGRTIVVPRFLFDHPELLRTAVAHERAHVARRDYETHLLVEVLAIFVAFHPAVWLLRRRIAEAREIACDELAAGDSRREYARSLVAIAALALDGRAPSAALAMAEKHSLEARVATLRGNAGGRQRGALLIPLAVFAAACGFGVQPRAGADLSGRWTLDRAATQFGRVERYESYTQNIEQRGNRIFVKQRRVYDRAVQTTSWSVTADGKQRPVDGVAKTTGTAQWRGDHLELALHSPGHEEYVAAFVTDGGRTLVCDGNIPTGRRPGRFRFVFHRERT